MSKKLKPCELCGCTGLHFCVRRANDTKNVPWKTKDYGLSESQPEAVTSAGDLNIVFLRKQMKDLYDGLRKHGIGEFKKPFPQAWLNIQSHLQNYEDNGEFHRAAADALNALEELATAEADLQEERTAMFKLMTATSYLNLGEKEGGPDAVVDNIIHGIGSLEADLAKARDKHSEEIEKQVARAMYAEEKLAEAREVIAELEKALTFNRGKLKYISAQAKAGHAGFERIANSNAEDGMKVADTALQSARAFIGEGK